MRPTLVTAALLCLACLALAACGPTPRVSPTPRAAAQADTSVRSMRVVKVWDMVDDALREGRDLFVSHYIEVDVIAGPDAGAMLTLPFDDRFAGRPLPRVGETITAAPADLVPRERVRQGR